MSQRKGTQKETSRELTEEEMSFLENCIPELAAAATSAAYWNALAHGISVTIVEGDAIIEVAPDGKKKWIKDLPPRSRAIIGETYKLR